MTDPKPYPKSEQLARGPKRRRRFEANARQWQTLLSVKAGPCRVCSSPGSNGRVHSLIELHHVVRRGHGGDDFADNLVPLCRDCHHSIHARNSETGRVLLSNLTDAEYAYMIDTMGESYPERAYGVEYSR